MAALTSDEPDVSPRGPETFGVHFGSLMTERRLLLLLLLAPLFGLIGLLVAEAIPDEQIAHRIGEAQRAGVIVLDDERPTALGTPYVRFSECGAFSIGLGDKPDENHFDSAVRSPVYPGGCQGLDSALREFDRAGVLPPGPSYFRYWHGYVVFTRPLLALTGVAGARWIALSCLIVSVAGMCSAVGRAFGGVAAALLVGPALLTSDMVIGGLSAFVAIAMSSAWVGGWMSFAVVTRRPDWRMAGLIAGIAGAINAYFDGLTTWSGAFALTVTGATLGVYAAHAAPSPRRTWRVSVAAAVGWATGLLWMWTWRWVLAATVVGVGGVVHDVTSQIEFRTSGGSSGVSASRTRGLTMPLSHWWQHPLTPWVLGAIVAIVVLTIARRWSEKAVIYPVALSVAIVTVTVVGSYPAMNNHSQIHFAHVYRSLPIALGAVATTVFVACTRPPTSDRPLDGLSNGESPRRWVRRETHYRYSGRLGRLLLTANQAAIRVSTALFSYQIFLALAPPRDLARVMARSAQSPESASSVA